MTYCFLCEELLNPPVFQWIYSKTTGFSYLSPEDMEDVEGIADVGTWEWICEKCFEGKIYPGYNDFLITTASAFDNEKIIEYKGIVTNQVFIDANMINDLFSNKGSNENGDSIVFKSEPLENNIKMAKKILLAKMIGEALKFKANAIVGLKIDFKNISKTTQDAFMITGTGTAVFLDNKPIFK